jgi:hypothetical protein
MNLSGEVSPLFHPRVLALDGKGNSGSREEVPGVVAMLPRVRETQNPVEPMLQRTR